MPKQTLYEDLRETVRHVLSLRERLLETAEDLESPDREKVQQTAARMLTFCTQLREIAKELPTDPEVDLFDAVDDPEELRTRIENALEHYFESALEDLDTLVKEREAREAEEEARERKE
jgi:hypothetical protein